MKIRTHETHALLAAATPGDMISSIPDVDVVFFSGFSRDKNPSYGNVVNIMEECARREYDRYL